jgi:phage shock protein A
MSLVALPSANRQEPGVLGKHLEVSTSSRKSVSPRVKKVDPAKIQKAIAKLETRMLTADARLDKAKEKAMNSLALRRVNRLAEKVDKADERYGKVVAKLEFLREKVEEYRKSYQTACYNGQKALAKRLAKWGASAKAKVEHYENNTLVTATLRLDEAWAKYEDAVKAWESSKALERVAKAEKTLADLQEKVNELRAKLNGLNGNEAEENEVEEMEDYSHCII